MSKISTSGNESAVYLTAHISSLPMADEVQSDQTFTESKYQINLTDNQEIN